MNDYIWYEYMFYLIHSTAQPHTKRVSVCPRVQKFDWMCRSHVLQNRAEWDVRSWAVHAED